MVQGTGYRLSNPKLVLCENSAHKLFDELAARVQILNFGI
jgi:hypothetical protein